MQKEGSKKKINQRIHAKRRAVQRYGITLTTRDLKEMENLIRAVPNRNVYRLVKSTNRITLWCVYYGGIWLPVAYDKKSGTIASILPERIIKKYEKTDMSILMDTEKVVCDQAQTKNRGVAKILTCPQCGKWATSETGLEEHRKAKHNVDSVIYPQG